MWELLNPKYKVADHVIAAHPDGTYWLMRIKSRSYMNCTGDDRRHWHYSGDCVQLDRILVPDDYAVRSPNKFRIRDSGSTFTNNTPQSVIIPLESVVLED